MKALIVVDMQYDFIDGALGTEEARSIVGNVRDKVAQYRASQFPVIYTQDTHSADYLQTQEGRNLPVVHCVKGTRGWEIVPEVLTDEATLIEKNGFGSLKLVEYLATLPGLEAVELVGVCTDICVVSNALLIKSAFPELPVAVDALCCAGVTLESHRQALETMKMCQVKVLGL